MEKSNDEGIFSEREIDLIKNCRVYSTNDPAGLPGHNLMVIVAKMADTLDIMAQMPGSVDAELVADVISRKYGRDAGHDPSKVLFGQIKKMAEASNFVRRDLISPRRTVESIAEAQGRDVIYACPDGTIRSNDGSVVGDQSGNLISEGFRGCLLVTFTNDEVFNEWLKEVTSNEIKPQHKESENA